MRRALILACAVLLLAPTIALADGDPASDVLLGEDVFYPYSPPVTPSIQKSLNTLTQNARQSGFPIKVALIQSPVDLGVIPDLFGKPQKYADFLDQEISFQGKQPLLVVMAAGYGVQGLPPKSTAAVPNLPKPAGKSSNDLANAALQVIPRLAAAAGREIKGGAHTTGNKASGASSSTLLIVLIATAALVALALALVTLRRKRPAAQR
jgi:hypothetical protein